MPFMKDDMKKKDEAVLEDMQKEINEAQSAETAADAEGQENPDAGEQTQETSAEQQLQAKIDELQASLQEKDERVKRLQADFENFRRRTRQEKEELSAVVTQTLLTDMLPLLDNFERAIAAETTDMDSFQKGIDMIYKQFKASLEKNGLEAIDTTDAKFDPNFHQAVMRVQDPEKEDDTIAAELQKGYMVKGRVIRPSMVQVVSN